METKQESTAPSEGDKGNQGNLFKVLGKVQKVDGSAVPNFLIRAVDVDLRNEEVLGKCTTDQSGYYEIPYSRDQFVRKEKATADLKVYAYQSPTSKLPPVATSKIFFNSAIVQTINLVIGGDTVIGPSEFAVLKNELTPLLGDLPPGDLVEDDKNQDLSFLAGETGRGQEIIGFFVTAHRHEASTKIPAEVFYGLFREGISTALPTLILETKESTTKALKTAISQNIIKGYTNDEIARFVSLIFQLGSNSAVKGPDGPTPIGNVLSTVTNDAGVFMNAYAQNTSNMEKFWTQIDAKPEFKGKTKAMQFTVQLGVATLNHAPLVKELQSRKEITTARDLTKFTTAQWQDIINKPEIGTPDIVPGGNAVEKVQNYATGVSRMVEDAFPTSFITQRLKDQSDDKTHGALPGKSDLNTFFEKNPEFAFTNTRAAAFLSSKPSALKDIKNVPTLRANLAGMQRLYRVAPQYTQMRSLVGAGINSSMQITNMGLSAFTARVGDLVGGPGEAAKIYERSSRTHAIASTLLATFNTSSSFAGIGKWRDWGRIIAAFSTKETGIPDWSTLFGSFDVCSCSECRSTTGPAAYYVDILHFLQQRLQVDRVIRDAKGEISKIIYKTRVDRKTRKTATETAKDILFDRRPDLGDIELSCQNTNTPLPYIDLTNEVLENAVSPPPGFTSFDLPSNLVTFLNNKQLADDLRKAFNPPLSEFADITVIKPDQWWTIDESAYTYTIRQADGGRQYTVQARSLQTKGTAISRAATPQYANSAAYDVIQVQVYPWGLPFDLWSQTVWTYLSHVAVGRYELMEVFSSDNREKSLVNPDIVRDFLGLTLMEQKLISGEVTAQVGAPSPGPWNLWGFRAEKLSVLASIPDPAKNNLSITKGTWMNVLTGRVDVFLQQSGMSYGELLNLMEISGIFYFEGGQIEIQIHEGELPDTCDPSKMELVGVDETVLLKIFKFCRLLRKLDGWSILDIALVLSYLGFPAAPKDMEDILVKISHIKRLMRTLDLSLELVMTFWYQISTFAVEDHENEDEDATVETLYSRIFRNQTIPRSTYQSSAQDPQSFPQDPEKLSGSLSDFVSTISAALNIGPTEFNFLLDSQLIVTDNVLSLENLSKLFRHILLAQSLDLTIEDYLSVLKLVASNPFENTTVTVLFVERVQSAAQSGFSWADLSNILRHDLSDESQTTALDQTIVSFLGDLRTNLRAIALDNTVDTETVDTDGGLTKKKLAQLSWNPNIITQAVAIINNTASYSVPLENPPPTIRQPQLQDKLSYDANTQILSYSRVMTNAERDALKGISGASPGFLLAIDNLYKAPRIFFARNMQSFTVPDFTVDLASFPDGIKIPASLRAKVYYVQSTAKLHSVGALSEPDRQTLLALANPATDSAYINAIKALFDAPNAFTPSQGDGFVTSANVSSFFDSAADAAGHPITPSTRYHTILLKLLPHLREKLSSQLVRQKAGELIAVNSEIAERLLLSWVTYSSIHLNDILRTTTFVESTDNSVITRLSFPNQYTAALLLTKIGLVINNMKLSATQLAWIFEFHQRSGDPTAAWLDLNALPVVLKPAALNTFAGWERLYALTQVRDGLSGNESTLDAIFKAARSSPPATAQISQLLATDLKVPKDSIDFLVGPTGFNLPLPVSFQDEVAIKRILRALKLFGDVGCSPANGALISKGEMTQRHARVTQLSIKSKYDEATWNTVAPQLSNILRENSRASLLAYLLAHPPSGVTAPWRTANDLFAYFLIDVEMGPCMKTSRIKQAISSVQLFVQRCLMNLEQDVTANVEADIFWKQWDWMKSFRISGANRQIYETPENFLEPSVRDDKTQAFKDLENELQQADVTSDTAETALRNYLDKLDEMSRLEVVSYYHQQELDLHGNTAVDIIHIFARTKLKPPRYFYCQRVDHSYWTSWEKLDADVQGDHLMPLVWNRRLYLFWVLFTEKARKQNIVMPQPNQPVVPPPTFWEIKLVWMERKQDKWQPKVISDAYLVCPKSGTVFDESDLSTSAGRSLITFRAEPDADTGELYIRCHNPGHLGDFYFNGVRGKPVALAPRGSLIQQIIEAFFNAVRPPAQSIIRNMGFGESDGSDGQLWVRTDKTEALAILGKTPGAKYNLAVPHQDFLFQSARPFWFQHDQSSFFIEPKDVKFPPVAWFPPIFINPGLLDGRLASPYYKVPIIRNPPILYPRSDFNGPLTFGQTFAARSDLVVMSKVSSGLVTAPTTRPSVAAFGLIPSLVQDLISSLAPFRKVDTSKFAIVPAQVAGFTLKTFKFSTFYHPLVSEMIRVLNRDGIDGLYQRPLQLLEVNNFNTKYKPSPVVVDKAYPGEMVDFDDNVYSIYNWELFFHVPVMIADKLSQNQKFKEAQQWYHRVFNPMDTTPNIPVPQRYWITKSFFQLSSQEYADQTIKAILNFLAKGGDPAIRSSLGANELKYLDLLEQGVARWRMEPFKPFVVARTRITAFQKWVVMKYLDNLIAWGDSLFAGDTIELINEATQLYILAADILGPRPLEMAPRGVAEVQTYNQLEPKLDAYSNALAAIEELVPPIDEEAIIIKPWPTQQPTAPSVTYFCSSKNDKLLGYWDTVADRLFKIRHCMNLLGIVRELPLFEPKIDPSMLIRAAAAGVDLSSAIADMNAPLPNHRFYYLAAKSTELCQELKSLGAAILTAIEKKDAGQLALLQSRQSIKLLEATKDVRLKRVEDAAKVAEALGKTKDVVQERHNYYKDRDLLNALEITHVALEGALMIPGLIDAGNQLVAAIMHFFPEIKLGAPTSIGATLGGSNMGKSSSKFSKFIKRNADLLAQSSRMTAEMASYQRRKEDWDFQARLASKELLTLDSQIASANIRFTIADMERQNQELQIDQAKEIDGFLRSKFSAVELYDWTVSQLSSVYFQTYRLVYEHARRAERAFALELGVKQPDFIAFDYWDSLRKGLTAGERLFNDIKRMEMAYMDQDLREYELTKSISLAQLDPGALMRLCRNGSCFFTIPEALFDLDYPGHYMRRIKAVSVTIPCVTGPYTGVCSTLSLLQSSVRTSTNLSNGKYARRDNDPRFADSYGLFQSIATSTGVNDTGVFEANLRDERYLPFERCGVISSWSMELPVGFPQYDYDTISDVVLTIRYTSRQGGAALATQASTELRDKALDAIAIAESNNGLARLFNLPNEFPDAWRRFLTASQTPPGSAPNKTTLQLTPSRFPYLFASAKAITVTRVDIFVRVRPDFAGSHNASTLSLTFSASATTPGSVLALSPWAPVPGASSSKPGAVFRASVAVNKPLGNFYITGSLSSGAAIDPDAIEQFVVLCHYRVSWT
ncbi:Fc.00g024380.m01.CDS01 [Cosmosporella sp. VM-42]